VNEPDSNQLELFSDQELDDLSWEEWFIALPLTPPSRSVDRFTDRLELFAELKRRRAA
jgi:hypothetical protein